MECIASNDCKYFEKEICNEKCPWYVALNILIRYSMIPDNYKSPIKLVASRVDLPKYKRLKEIQDNMDTFVKEGNNLLIYSAGCGNGKTSWAVKLLHQYFVSIEDSNYMDVRGLFVNVVELLTEVRVHREYDDANAKEDIQKIISKINDADLVVWDEIGVRQLTEYEQMFLYTYINRRVSNKKANIYTSNCDCNKMEQMIGYRLFSRIFTLSEKVEFNSPDFRHGGAK